MSTVCPAKTVGLRQVLETAPETTDHCSLEGCSIRQKAANTTLHCPFGLIGLSYRTASLDLRGRATFKEEGAKQLIGLLQAHGIREAMVLSTCNRTEVYFAHSDEMLVMRLLAAAAKTDLEEIRPHIYVKKSLCAACHLFRVASGLDSAVLGETEIVSQVKQAWKTAEQLGTCGPGLGLLLQRAMEVNKRIRTETDLCRGVTSTATLAVMKAERQLGSLKGKRIVLVGAGQIAERVCKDLAPLKVGALRILNRSAEKAQRLAGLYGGVVGGLEELEESMADADVVITAASSPDPLITDELIARIAGRRPDAPLLIDLGVPANIRLRDAAQDAAVINIDELSAACSDNLERRAGAVPVALDVLDEELVRLRSELTMRTASPTIKALVQQAEHIRRMNLDWALERLTGLTDKERKVVEDLSNKIIKGLLQAPIQGLKHELAAAEHREIVAKLFKLDETDQEQVDESLAS